MNAENRNTREDEKWQGLLMQCAPTFAGEAEPPYGFVTSTVTQIRFESRQLEDIERIGWRALLASFAALVIAATVTISLDLRDRGGDFDLGEKSLIQMENIPVS